MSGNSTTHMLFAPLPDNPLVSVLMPAYNAAPFLKNALNSILNQTHTNWELLLLDDGSTDRTTDIIQEIADVRVRKFSNPHNEGYLKACNRLFKEVKGDLVTFLDADDTCIPERFALCIAALREDSDLGFVTTDFLKTDPYGIIISRHADTVDLNRIAIDPSYYPKVCCATLLLRSSLLIEIGGYHPFFDRIGGEDQHWLFHMALSSKGLNIPTYCYNYTTHPNQTHLKNQADIKYFIPEIVTEIKKQWLLHGSDLLLHSHDLRIKWETHLQKHSYELIFRKASSALNNRQWGRAIQYTLKIPLAATFTMVAWKRFFYMTYSILKRLFRPETGIA